MMPVGAKTDGRVTSSAGITDRKPAAARPVDSKPSEAAVAKVRQRRAQARI